jgi:hypothetical protein
MLSAIYTVLSAIYAESHFLIYAEFHYAECHYGECHLC